MPRPIKVSSAVQKVFRCRNPIPYPSTVSRQPDTVRVPLKSVGWEVQARPELCQTSPPSYPNGNILELFHGHASIAILLQIGLAQTLCQCLNQLRMSLPAYRNQAKGKAEVEMFLGEKQMRVYFGDAPVTWYTSQNTAGYRCQALDPTTFPKAFGKPGGVPFKYKHENHEPALEGYVRAYLTNRVDEAPKFLTCVSLDLQIFDECIQAGTIVIHAHMKTAMFMRDVTPENYPSSEMCFKGNDVAIESAFNDMLAHFQEQRINKKKRPQNEAVEDCCAAD